MGYGEEKLFLKSFLPRLKNIKHHNPAFSLAQEAQRKSLAKRKRRFMGSAQTRKLLKKLDQNFHAWVQCEHLLLDGRAQNVNLDNPRLKVFGATFFQKGSKNL